MVPASSGDGVRGNVWSGTVLDNSITQLGTKMTGLSIDEEAKRNFLSDHKDKMQPFADVDDSSDDFLLTAQGGLKGTSKPIFYRVRLNENKVWGPKGATPLTKDNLKGFTYKMSFAVRSENEISSPSNFIILIFSYHIAPNFCLFDFTKVWICNQGNKRGAGHQVRQEAVESSFACTEASSYNDGWKEIHSS